MAVAVGLVGGEPLGRAQPAFPGDQAPAAVVCFLDEDGLEHPDGGDRGDQLGQLLRRD